MASKFAYPVFLYVIVPAIATIAIPLWLGWKGHPAFEYVEMFVGVAFLMGVVQLRELFLNRVFRDIDKGQPGER